MVLVLELERGSSKHLVQYNTKWESEFPWLVPKKDTCKVGVSVLVSTTTPQCGARLHAFACAKTASGGIV